MARSLLLGIVTILIALHGPDLLMAVPAARGGEAPITVFVARKILTMDPGWPVATAVAVRDGKILSVGSLAGLKPWLDRGEPTIDRTLAEKVLLPGLIEPHGHPLIGGTALTRPLLTYLLTPNPYGPAFPGVKTRAEALAKLREYAAKAAAPAETVLAWGYDLIALGGRHLDKTILDEVSATRPLLVWDASEHFVYANSAALRKYRITRADTKLNGVMAGPDGQPDGRFLGTTAAQRILQAPLAELLRPAVALRSIRFLVDLSRQNGHHHDLRAGLRRRRPRPRSGPVRQVLQRSEHPHALRRDRRRDDREGEEGGRGDRVRPGPRRAQQREADLPGRQVLRR